MILGLASTTGDREGEISHVSDKKPSKEEVTEALRRFTGKIQQIPPAFSAIKINGKRAYALARKGHEVKLDPREVTIHGIRLTSYNYPEVTFMAHVSSGTYIRTLAEDIGKKLGTGAYLGALRRTEVGDFSLENALTTDVLTAQNIPVNLLKSS
jgi:tRNA pseudouridine55 synthase